MRIHQRANNTKSIKRVDRIYFQLLPLCFFSLNGTIELSVRDPEKLLRCVVECNQAGLRALIHCQPLAVSPISELDAAIVCRVLGLRHRPIEVLPDFGLGEAVILLSNASQSLIVFAPREAVPFVQLSILREPVEAMLEREVNLEPSDDALIMSLKLLTVSS